MTGRLLAFEMAPRPPADSSLQAQAGLLHEAPREPGQAAGYGQAEEREQPRIDLAAERPDQELLDRPGVGIEPVRQVRPGADRPDPQPRLVGGVEQDVGAR